MYEARSFGECEGAMHVLNGETMVPSVATTFAKLGPSAQGFLQSLADVACSTGAVDRGSWLSIAQQYLSCALVRVVGLCSVSVIRIWLKKLGKTFLMVLLCHSSECA